MLRSSIAATVTARACGEDAEIAETDLAQRSLKSGARRGGQAVCRYVRRGRPSAGRGGEIDPRKRVASRSRAIRFRGSISPPAARSAARLT
jgi:hypothetical protein